jgi:hypothetical protein
MPFEPDEPHVIMFAEELSPDPIASKSFVHTLLTDPIVSSAPTTIPIVVLTPPSLVSRLFVWARMIFVGLFDTAISHVEETAAAAFRIDDLRKIAAVFVIAVVVFSAAFIPFISWRLWFLIPLAALIMTTYVAVVQWFSPSVRPINPVARIIVSK